MAKLITIYELGFAHKRDRNPAAGGQPAVTSAYIALRFLRGLPPLRVQYSVRHESLQRPIVNQTTTLLIDPGDRTCHYFEIANSDISPGIVGPGGPLIAGPIDPIGEISVTLIEPTTGTPISETKSIPITIIP